MLNLYGLCVLSIVISPLFASFFNSALTKRCGSLIVWAMVLAVLFPFLISLSSVVSISFLSAVFLRVFSIGDSMLYFVLRSSRFW